MAGFLGAMLGGLILTFFVALLFKKLIFSSMDEPNRFLASNVSSLLVATTIYDWVKFSRASA